MRNAVLRSALPRMEERRTMVAPGFVPSGVILQRELEHISSKDLAVDFGDMARDSFPIAVSLLKPIQEERQGARLDTAGKERNETPISATVLL